MNTVCLTLSETMAEESTIKKFGNSMVIVMKRDALKVYGLDVGSKILIEYKYPNIVIRKAPTEPYLDEKKKSKGG